MRPFLVEAGHPGMGPYRLANDARRFELRRIAGPFDHSAARLAELTVLAGDEQTLAVALVPFQPGMAYYRFMY